ncbi:RTA1 domain protein [Venturia nashicola]|uniref:RTA1 domain protein n=1 Tax=Venturia nashicola TaxID=86259 RepID=A0A4Z1PTG3_9PEZI|nr:RTA1 domain protein [Venturia nashicola]TLD39335.1 RTA1 domain protein [Venturia nashicola]
MLEPRKGGFSYYRYDPSVAAAILFIVLFSLATLLHAYQMFRTRTWFLIPFVLGGLCETIGYVGRTVSAAQTGERTLGPYIVQSVLPLVAPALFAASIYMELGRIVEVVEGDANLFIRRKFLTAIFVCGDILSFFLQGAGGGLMASKTNSTQKLGTTVIEIGLGVQIAFFVVFVLAATIFHWRMQKNPTSRSLEIGWQKHMTALYSTSLLILIRSIFRLVEFSNGFDGPLLHHEVYIYVFDAMLMLFAMLIMNWIHPSEIKSWLRGGRAAQGFRMKTPRVTTSAV